LNEMLAPRCSGAVWMQPAMVSEPADLTSY